MHNVFAIFYKNLSNFYFEERVITKHEFFFFLLGRYIVIGSSIDMNVGAFCENSVSFLKSVVLQLSPTYSESYANLNVKSRPKFSSP